MVSKKKNFFLGEITTHPRKKIRTCFIKGVFILTFCHAVPALSEEDKAKKIQFDMPSSDLASALNSYAEKTGMELSYPASMVVDAKSKPLKGSYGVQQGLNELLRGTGLAYRLTGENSVTLEKMAVAEPKSSTPTLKAMTVVGEAVQDPNDPYSKDYAVTNTRTATKTDTPIFDTPVSVQVVPRAVMDDQKTTRLKDALENVSGVRAQPSLGYGNGFIIRGFRNGRVYRNGLLSNGNGEPTEVDAGNLQSIEVLKGPAAVLFGRIEPGGLVNVTTKKPLDTPYYSLEQQFGSYDLYRTQWDATGAVTDDKSLLYRFTGAYQNNNSFRDFVSTDRVMVNPSITWRPTDKTDMTLSVEGFDQDYQTDFGIPVIGKRPAPIPISRSLNDPNIPMSYISKTQVSTEINHRFNDDWAIHNRFLASFNDAHDFMVNPAPAFGPSEDALLPDGTLKRNIFGQTADTDSYTTNLDLTGKFQLGATKHETLVGFDYFQTSLNYHYFGEFIDPNPALDINIFNPGPSYGIDPALINQTLSQPANCCAGFNYAVINDQWYGAYFQDHITLWDKLHILGGGRYDWAETGSSYMESFAAAEATLPSRKDEGFSPRVGILYQPIKELGVYGNWTTSFGANNAPAADGSSFDPQIGEQFEAGVKTQLFDDRFIATLAYYHLTKDNVLIDDDSTPNPFDKIANQQRSQGIELDMTGHVADALSLIGSYAFTDARVIKDFTGGTQGNRLANVPEHSGSLWLKYDLNGYAALDGFSFGLGGVAAGQREGDFQNSFQLPGYVRMDAFAAYKWDIKKTRVTAQFNIRNLLDKQYYESTDPDSNVTPRLSVAPGAPLTAIGSLRVEF